MSDLTNEDESEIYECPVVSKETMLALLVKNQVKCADYYVKCRSSFERMELWKHLGDKRVMALQQALQKAEQERDDLRQELTELKGEK